MVKLTQLYLNIHPYKLNNNYKKTNSLLMKSNETFNKFYFNSFPTSPDYCVNFNNSFTRNNYYSMDDLDIFYFNIEFDQSGFLIKINTNSTNDIVC